MGCTASTSADAPRHRARTHRRKAHRRSPSATAERIFTVLMAERRDDDGVGYPHQQHTCVGELEAASGSHSRLGAGLSHTCNPLAPPSDDDNGSDHRNSGRMSPGVVIGSEPSEQLLMLRRMELSATLSAQGYTADVEQFADEVAATDQIHRQVYSSDAERQQMVESWVAGDGSTSFGYVTSDEAASC